MPPASPKATKISQTLRLCSSKAACSLGQACLAAASQTLAFLELFGVGAGTVAKTAVLRDTIAVGPPELEAASCCGASEGAKMPNRIALLQKSCASDQRRSARARDPPIQWGDRASNNSAPESARKATVLMLVCSALTSARRRGGASSRYAGIMASRRGDSMMFVSDQSRLRRKTKFEPRQPMNQRQTQNNTANNKKGLSLQH